MTTRRRFIKTAGLGGAAALAAPAIVKAQAPIKWRFQTYAGGALGEHVTKPMVDYVNDAANGEMEIELFYADQIVPTGELFQALQRGTIDAVHSDDDSMASPTPLRQFGGYFPFATKHILDVPVLFNQYGLADIWRSEYEKVGVQRGFRPPDRIRATSTRKRRSRPSPTFDGLKLYTFPTAGPLPGEVRRRCPVTIPYEDAEVAVQTGELDGMSWSGITEDYTVGWADVTDYFLTNNISGAWIGSWFVNQQRWAELPDHLKSVVMAGHRKPATHTATSGTGAAKPRLRANAATKLQLRYRARRGMGRGRERGQGLLERSRRRKARSTSKIVGIFREYNSKSSTRPAHRIPTADRVTEHIPKVPRSDSGPLRASFERTEVRVMPQLTF
jgi:TRAP-type mannitol/chloroaromatic compound transport system substrate-binding protein